MARIAYANGRYCRLDTHTGAGPIAIEDRGLQFADSVYEVIKVVAGRPRALGRHLERLGRSLASLEIPPPMTPAALALVLREVWRRNRLSDGLIYIQVTRGTAVRRHGFPPPCKPSLIVTVRAPGFSSVDERAQGIAVITVPDLRWGRCDIKSTSLLPNVLARQQAEAQGAREAWMLDRDGMVTEGTSSNAYIVDRTGRLITQPLSESILGGVTRSLLLELAGRQGVDIVERPFSRSDALAASEAALSSTSSWLLPVVAIDGHPVGDGRPGPVIQRLVNAYEGSVIESEQANKSRDVERSWQING